MTLQSPRDPSRARPAAALGRVLACTLLPALLAAGSTHRAVADGASDGAAVAIIDSGTFTHYVRGARVGEERFVISEERAGADGTLLRAGAELNLKQDGEISRIRVALEIVGPESLPRRYEVDIDGPKPATIVVAKVRDRLRLNVQSPDGQEMRQFLIRPRSMILDEGMAHHYYFPARILGDHASIDATLFVPRGRTERKATIRDLGEQETAVSGGRHRLRHLVIQSAGQPVNHVWLRGQRVVRVEIPEEGWIAERADATQLLGQKGANR